MFTGSIKTTKSADAPQALLALTPEESQVVTPSQGSQVVTSSGLVSQESQADTPPSQELQDATPSSQDVKFEQEQV